MASQSQWFNAGISMKVHRESLDMQRKTSFPFAFLSFFRNFGYTELTLHSDMQRKTSFPFAFLSFFRNFAIKFTTIIWKIANKWLTHDFLLPRLQQ
jgi:hypothetical protein